MIYLYSVLLIFAVALPVIIASIYAGKRGRSTRTLIFPFVLPYAGLIALLFLWLLDLKGIDLLIGTLLAAGFATLIFYLYSGVGDIGLRQRKK